MSRRTIQITCNKHCSIAFKQYHIYIHESDEKYDHLTVYVCTYIHVQNYLHA